MSAPPQTRAGTPASSNVSAAEGLSGESATLVSIPAGPQSEEFSQLVVSKFTPLWQQRQILNVAHGYAFEVGDFRVRIGELRQGGSGIGAQTNRGTIVEVQFVGKEEGEGEDWEEGEAIIDGFWDGLGVKGARKVFWVPGLGEGDGSVRQWCEILRIRT